MQTGTLLHNRYQIESVLGEGGMGVVYKGHDRLLNRAVAVKSLSTSLIGEEGLRRLLREAQAAAQLAHPNIVTVHDIVDDGQNRVIVMEFVEGHPLSQQIPLDVPTAVKLAMQVCAALQHAHSKGIVHRDIKPDNILVTPDGTAKLMDFGLARSEGRSRMTQPGLIVGTVAYMAPEQILGGIVDARSDLYSLGCVLYEALTGRKPFDGDDPFTILSQHVNVTPVAPRWHNSVIPAVLDAIIMRLMAKDPAERHASAADVIEALELALQPEAEETAAPAAPAVTRMTLLEHIVRGKLVGRGAELAELREHLDRTLSGEGRVVMLSGEPGIGKTRLAEELAIYAHLRGTWVLRGHCYEQDVGVPYLPFVESLRQLFAQSGHEPIKELGERADDLARFLPEIGRVRPQAAGLSPEDERIRLFEAVIQWVSVASRRRPLVFILDDLHWGDRASLRLLHQLARALQPNRMLLLGTYREIELDLQHPLNDALTQMNRERLFFRLPLRRLSESDTRALLSGLFGEEISEELSRAIFQETEGNPFFIEEVVKALVEEGKIYRSEGRWQRLAVAELEIPQSVKATIGRRLVTASDACRRVITVAAVVGREFDPDVLVAVSQLPEDEVLDAIDEAARLQLIRETKVGRVTKYAFEHALIRQTLYENLNARRRARLHQEVGEAMERLFRARLDDHLEEVAYHFGEAGVPTADKGIDYNIRAAEKAAGLYALEEGVRRLSVALELAQALGDRATEVRVHKALGDLFRAFAENRQAATGYQRALDLLKEHAPENTEEVLSLSLTLSEATTESFGGDFVPQAGVYAQEAVRVLHARGDQPLLARALALLAMHQVRSGDLPEARRHAQEAIALAERLGAEDELRMAYRAMAWVHRSSNEWPQFREMVERHRALRTSGVTAADVNLHVDLVQSLLSGGNYAEAERAAHEFLALAEKLRSPTAIFQACQWLGVVAFTTNRWDEALEFSRRARELGERLRGMDFMLGWVLRREAWMLWARGQEDEARGLIGRIEALQYDVPPAHQGARQQALELARRIGDLDLIRRLMLRLEAEKPHCLTCTLEFHVTLGMARLALGEVEAAEARLRAAQEVLPPNPEPEYLAEAAWLRAHIVEARGDLAEAVQHAEVYLRLLAGQPMWLEQALMWQDAARILLRRGQPDDIARGRNLLAEALALYEQVGARRPEAEAKELLASVKEQ